MMRWFMIGAGAIGLLAVCLASYVFAELNGAFVPKRSFAETKELLRPHLQVYRPEGDGPFPVVLAFTGCGGVRDTQRTYGEAAVAVGAMFVVVDSMAARGISYEEAVATVCAGRKLRGRERAGDVYAGVSLVSEIDNADPTRIGLLGWSHGGWTIMDALALDWSKQNPHGMRAVPAKPLAGVKAISLIYPYAGFPALTPRKGWHTTSIPTEILVVSEDQTALRAPILEAAEKARAAGARVVIDEWDDATLTHAFDEPDLAPDARYRYDQAAAARSLARFQDWIGRTLLDANSPGEEPSVEGSASEETLNEER